MIFRWNSNPIRAQHRRREKLVHQLQLSRYYQILHSEFFGSIFGCLQSRELFLLGYIEKSGGQECRIIHGE